MANSGIWFLNLSFTFIPFLLDTGVQIWNAVEVNDVILKVEDPGERQKVCELKFNSSQQKLKNCIIGLYES